MGNFIGGSIISAMIGLIFGVYTYELGRRYSKFEQVAVKHCIKTLNQECGIADCIIEDKGKYKCSIPYTSNINENKIKSNLVVYCDEKFCE